ncbi:hypothetical protein B0H17DRAFT_1148786 [Mycena rosella]|uniref:Uncharacterized protein n=1 Tax=Mycena rosella TaxID=1033263 RepID=A0AAD7C9A0_MYCRO|nr:hypothetical protein B0H17DRAFT_1148786 [Mycena rosella]
MRKESPQHRSTCSVLFPSSRGALPLLAFLLSKMSFYYSHAQQMRTAAFNITITDGTFNVLERPRSPPSDFRSVRLGDLNLLTQTGNEDELTSPVVERRGPRLVRRKVIVGTRKVYRARIFGSQDPMTAVLYEGSQFEKWKAEAKRRQSVRLPFVLQLFGVTESRDVNALIYHDGKLITITQFRQLHRGSPLVTQYIEYQMVRDQDSNPKAQDDAHAGSYTGPYIHPTPSIRMSTGRLCYHDLGLPLDGFPSGYISADLIPWEMTFSITPGTRDIEQQLFSRMDMCDIHTLLMLYPSYGHVELSIHDRIPFCGRLATAGGDLLDFHVHFPDSERSKVEPHVHPWRVYDPPIGTDITVLDTQWTRITLPADNLSFGSYISIPDIRRYTMRESWISQAPCLLESGIATGVKLDDLLLINTVELVMQLDCPNQNTDPASNLPYLFVSLPAGRFEEAGSNWLDILPADQRCY